MLEVDLTEDTAVAEPEVIPVEVPEPAPEPVQEEPVIEDLSLPETSDEPEPETTEPVAPETVKPFEDLTPDELKADARVKELIEAEATSRTARELESVRRTQEAATQKAVAEQNKTQAQQFMQQGLVTNFTNLLARIQASDTQQFSPEHYSELQSYVAQAANAANVAAGMSALASQFNTYTEAKEVPGWEIPKALGSEYDTALGSQDTAKAASALMSIHGSREFARGVAKGIEQEAAAAKTRLKTTQKVETEEQAAAKRASEATPTEGTGKAASERSDLDIIGNPDYSRAEQDAAYERHFGAPYQR